MLTLALAQYQAGPIIAPLQPSPLPHLSSPIELTPRLRSILAATPQSTGVQTGSDIQVTTDPNNLPQNEPSIAINPTDPFNLVASANDYRIALVTGGAWLGYYSSKDGGRTWSNKLIPGFPGDNTTTPLSGYTYTADPGVAFDNNGNAYISGIAYNVRGNNVVDGTVFVSKSTDSGATFPSTTLVYLGDGTKIFNDKPYLTTDQSTSTHTGTVYVSWTKFTQTDATIQTSYSRDGGATFSAPKLLSVSGSNQGSVPAVGPNGEVYVVWHDFVCGFQHCLRIAKSLDGGLTFNLRSIHPVITIPDTLPPTNFRVNSFPTLAVDELNGNVYVAWADDRSLSFGADILFTRSTDGGFLWSDPYRVNDDTTTNDQFFPWMAASNGTISIVFYDRREDPNNHHLNLFYARSQDRGVTFETNVKVSDLPINPDINFQGTFIGDYIGVAADPSRARPVWTDTRNLNQDIYTDVVSLSQTHDIAVHSLVPERGFAYATVSATLKITVNVQNLGAFPESFSATVTAGSFNLGTQTSPVIPAGTSITLTFTWSTQSVALGTYTIVGSASVLANETSTLDNFLTDGTVQIRFPGDVNADGIVNIIDLATVGAAFGTTNGNPGYKPEADINNDAQVNIIDLSIVGSHFGAVAP